MSTEKTIWCPANCDCVSGCARVAMSRAVQEAERLHRREEVAVAVDKLLMKTPAVIGPTRATSFPDTAEGRKQHPVASGVLDYFPDALVVLSRVSWEGNNQHNPGEPLHWARNKSSDESDALIRHFLQRGTVDSDGILHSAKMAWRALALLQKEIESSKEGV